MANRSHAAAPGRWGARVVGRIALLLLFGMLLSYVVVQLWTARTDDLTVVDTERKGGTYLKPVTHLVDELTKAQSAAVRASQPDSPALEAAIAGVDAVDKNLGTALGTHQRWSDVRAQIAAATAQRLSGDAAYRTYTSVVALAIELCRKAGDTSNLILDPVLDSYYLMDTALLRVPDILVAAGRAADLAVLATQAPSEAARSRVSIARYQVAVASEAVGTGLRKAMEATGSATLGPNVTGRFDVFRSAVDAFVPPAMLLQTLDTADPATVVRSAERVRDAAGPLADSVYTELDRVLRARHDALSTQRLGAASTAGVGLLLGLVLLWLLLPGAPRPAALDTEFEGDAGMPGEPMEASAGQPADTTFVDPHDLAAVEELLHVGRAVRTRRPDRSDNAG